ncbi:MAG: alpha/beta fold hydrolase [Porphyrobacter sp.]|jgi:magnesium chelatase accessory protein|nr:alpha/beta fold hydrolase [Porphyrobacter sp.]
MARPLDWSREGLLWPHRESSEFVRVGGARWHVQRMGTGAPLLLLHGTGASVHSWRDVMPLLAKTHEVIALDLPRHAFTTGHAPDALSLVRMAGEVARLLKTLDVAPAGIIGHSAGAALALQLALDHGYTGPIVGLNAALRPFPGVGAQLFPAVAKLFLVNPLVPRIFSGSLMRAGETERFLSKSTGSVIDAGGMACYSALFRNPAHAKGALAMMANWDLPTLKSRIGGITNRVLLVHSDRDAAIPLDWTREASGWIRDARLEVLPGLGHLAHEEAPEQAAALIAAFLAQP